MIRMRYPASLAPMTILLDTRVLGIGEKCRGSAGHLIVDFIRTFPLLYNIRLTVTMFRELKLT
jgi:hypothetical protein